MSRYRAPLLTAVAVSTVAFATCSQASTPNVDRTWISQNGKYQVDASLVAVKHGWVKLRKSDGSTVTAQLSRLCEADQNYSIQWVFATRDEVRQPHVRPKRPPKKQQHEVVVDLGVCLTAEERNAEPRPRANKQDAAVGRLTQSQTPKPPMSRAEVSRYWAAKRRVVEANRRRQYAIRTAQTAYIMAATRPRPVSYLLPPIYPRSESSSRSSSKSKSSSTSKRVHCNDTARLLASAHGYRSSGSSKFRPTSTKRRTSVKWTTSKPRTSVKWTTSKPRTSVKWTNGRAASVKWTPTTRRCP